MKLLHGVYLVIDPKQQWDTLLEKLRAALKGGIRIVQLWDHWQTDIEHPHKLAFISKVKSLVGPFNVPLLMHEDWKLALEANLEGVHFDQVPQNFEEAKKALIGKYIGLTVGNDLRLIAWADHQQLSYVSFCAMFPTASVSSCEIVDPETVIKARELTQLPIFLSGGIDPDNVKKLSSLPFVGVAIISGILNATNPEEATRRYVKKLNELVSISYEN